MVINIVLKMAEKILSKHPHWSPEINGVILQRMSKDFHSWVYNEGYKLFKEKQFASHDSDYVKLPKYIDIANVSGVRPSDIKKVCDAIKQLSKFAYSQNVGCKQSLKG